MAVFAKAVELGSFAATASALDLSGPMVGKHVRFLEQMYGVTLLNRTTRRQSLTEIGRIYYERCKVILAEMAVTDSMVADQRSEPRGRLRVSVPVHFGRQCVAPVLLDLTVRHPELELELSFTDRLIDLSEEDVDLAIRTGTLADSGETIAKRLASQTMIVCAAPSYIQARGLPGQLGEIAEHDTVLYRRFGNVAPWLFPDDGLELKQITLSSRLRFDDLKAIAEAVAAGAGLGWLPSWLVREELEAGVLVNVWPQRQAFLYDVYAVWLRSPHMPMRIRLAINELAAALPQRV